MKLRIVIATCFASMLAGCATSPGPSADDAARAAALQVPAEPRERAGSLDELKQRLLKLNELTVDETIQALPDVPVFVEFEGSPRLSAAVAQDLRARGVRIADSRQTAGGVLRLSGRFELYGSIGRRFFSVGETFEKIAEQNPEVARLGDPSAALSAMAGARDAAMAQGLYRVGLFD